MFAKSEFDDRRHKVPVAKMKSTKIPPQKNFFQYLLISYLSLGHQWRERADINAIDVVDACYPLNEGRRKAPLLYEFPELFEILFQPEDLTVIWQILIREHLNAGGTILCPDLIQRSDSIFQRYSRVVIIYTGIQPDALRNYLVFCEPVQNLWQSLRMIAMRV
jgi:hypothetical protein